MLEVNVEVIKLDLSDLIRWFIDNNVEYFNCKTIDEEISNICAMIPNILIAEFMNLFNNLDMNNLSIVKA